MRLKHDFGKGKHNALASNHAIEAGDKTSYSHQANKGEQRDSTIEQIPYLWGILAGPYIVFHIYDLLI